MKQEEGIELSSKKQEFDMVQSLIQVYDSKIYESNHKIDMLKESQKDLIKTFEKLEQSNDNLRQLIGEKCQ